MRPTIGLESGMLRGPKTGIGNYTFHIVRAMLEQDASFRYMGFGGVNWREIDLASVTAAARGSGDDPQPAPRGMRTPAGLSHHAMRAAMRLSGVPPARAIYRMVYRRRFAASVHAQRLDLFHAFNFRPPSDPGAPVLPVIYDLSTFRHPEFHPADRVRWLDSMAETVARVPLVQTISEFSKSEIISVFGIPAERIFVAPPAAASLYQPAGYEPTQRDLGSLGLTHGDFFLTVGTLEPRKNIRTLIAAYARLSSAQRARCPLVVVGGKGWGNLDLPAQAEALRRDGALRFHEGITNRQLRSLYEGARLMLMPSLYEGFGMPVVEALACGAAVAHSAGTSMDEISGSLGRRVVAEDVDGWTAVLSDSIMGGEHADPALRDARAERARQFTWQRSAELVLAAYRQLLPG